MFAPPAPPGPLDWRKQNAVTSVKNQLACNSCFIFAATGALESAYYRANHVTKYFSEQAFLDCMPWNGSGVMPLCVTGGVPMWVHDFATKRGVVLQEQYLPYTGAVSVIVLIVR